MRPPDQTTRPEAKQVGMIGCRWDGDIPGGHDRITGRGRRDRDVAHGGGRFPWSAAQIGESGGLGAR